MIGYDAAVAWLQENAPDWRLMRSDTKLVPAGTQGGPTGALVEVVLYRREDEFGEGPILTGEGGTMLAAVQQAVGDMS